MEKKICAYCKEKEGTGSPICCNKPKCKEDRQYDAAMWEADCEREREAVRDEEAGT